MQHGGNEVKKKKRHELGVEMENHQARKRPRSSKGTAEEKAAMAESNIEAAAELGFRQWQHPSSRIFRVSHASGGKDRHSKVFTSKGLRDRRVRLSVSTAIQFYDLQDRLGYDQPSKAIEWLIKAASTAIAELPSLPSSFPELPEPVDGEQNLLETAEAEPDHNHQQQQQHAASLSKSGSSSTSETSKGSVLSLSRSEIRFKARERARERAAKDKEKNREEGGDHLAATDNSQSSFTELLTGGSNNAVSANTIPVSTQMQLTPPSTATEGYFAEAGGFARTAVLQKYQAQQLPSSFCSPQAQIFRSSPAVGIVPHNIGASTATTAGDNLEMQHLSFINDYSHIDYNVNFSIAAGLTGFQRGTLQSNSSAHFTPHHHNLLCFSSSSSSSASIEGPNLPFLFGAAAPESTDTHFHSGFGSRLQLTRELPTAFFLDGYMPPDLKGKGKS